MDDNLLAVFGGLITLLLSVNAFYFKDIVSSLRKIELQLVKLTTEHDQNMSLLKDHDREIKKMRDRIHDLEGYSSGIVKALEDIKQ
jgi:hypothetical protein